MNKFKTVSFIGIALLLAFVTLTGCKSDSGSSSFADNTFVYSEGTTLHLIQLDENGSVEELSQAGLPTDDLEDGQMIFGIIRHPEEPWIYVTSMTYDWTGSRIDRFSLSSSGLTYDGCAYVADDKVGIDYDDEYYWAPVSFAFNSDGSRAYVNDDDYDVMQIFSVDDNGDFTFLWDGRDDETEVGTELQGMAVSPDDAYAYCGSYVYALSNDTAGESVSGSGGNATSVKETDSGTYLTTAINNSTLNVYSLADYAAPSLIDSEELGSMLAMFQDSSEDCSTFLVSGKSSVATYTFDGSALTAGDTYTSTDTLYNRGCAISADGQFGIVTSFSKSDGQVPEHISIFGISLPAGTLTLLDTIDTDGVSRAVLRIK